MFITNVLQDPPRSETPAVEPVESALDIAASAVAERLIAYDRDTARAYLDLVFSNKRLTGF